MIFLTSEGPRHSPQRPSTLSSAPAPGKILYVHLAYRDKTVPSAADVTPEWYVGAAVPCPYRAFFERLVDARKLVERLFESGAEVTEGQVRVGRVLAGVARRQWDPTGAYLNFFYAPFRSYSGTTVSNEGGEDDVWQENDGREEDSELALAD